MAEEVLISISLIIVISALATIVARIIRQPPIIGYLIAGVLAGPLFLNIIGTNADMIQLFAHIGVAFLLFIVGLSLDLRVLKEVGWVSLFAGSAQIIITGLLGFMISMGLGLPVITSVYLGIVLAFSSTVVAVKILSDKKEIDTLHGRIALGILILQDFVAALILMIVPLISDKIEFFPIAPKFSIAIGLIAFIFLFSHFVLNRFLNYLARSQETLFLFGIAWALVLSTVFFNMGFSLEIGALVAGMSLASSKYNLELGGKMKPLRDFFVVLFFVYFGSQLTGPITIPMITMAVIFSLFIIIGKPLIVMFILRLSGYKKKTNFMAGLSIAQISEFSLIILLLGLNLGHLTKEIISLAVMIAIITIGISSYIMYYSISIFNKIGRFLSLFEGKRFRKDIAKKETYDIIMFGYHRIGFKILKELIDMKASFVIVDYNPKVILSLGKQGVNCIFGDAGDKEFLKELDLVKAKIIISTIPDESSNIMIRERIKEVGSTAVFIATTEQPASALDLYNKGVDYVILPQHLGGVYAANMIKNFHLDKIKYKEEGRKNKRELIDAKKSSTFFSKS